MSPSDIPPPWTKAIPPSRDRLQSRILVSAVTPILCALTIRAIARDLSPDAPRSGPYLLEAIAISAAFALLVWLLKAATPAAAACGAAICLLLTLSPSSSPPTPSLLHSGLPPLIALFILTFAATRFGRAKKEARGLSEPPTGRRASQVIANLGIAALAAASGNHSSFAHAAALAALAEATADTLSSEIGQTIAGPAFLITTARRVPPGTDGAISLAGTLAGLLGAAAIVCAGSLGMAWSFKIALFAAATAGLLFDSLLGATLERHGWLGNDLVNLASTLFAAALYPLILLAAACSHL